MKAKKGLALVIANADYLQQNKLPTCSMCEIFVGAEK